MIATHTAKMFNAKLKTSGINADIVGHVPESLICSQTTNMRRKFWAAPTNAGDLKRWREAVKNLPADYVVEAVLPGITDTHLKQILLPLANWQSDDYVSATPVSSMGLLHEVFHRLYEKNLIYKPWVIQPLQIASGSHGEALMSQGGRVRLLQRGIVSPPRDRGWRGDFVQLTARCEHMNISSGMLAVGFPAMSAIGGLVHSIERNFGCEIDFAFGVQSSSWAKGVPRLTMLRPSGVNSGARLGRIKGLYVNPFPGFQTDEITATAEIVLLMRTDVDLNALYEQALSNDITRLAGGFLFDTTISIVKNGTPPKINYIRDASALLKTVNLANGDNDNLDVALSAYSVGGGWDDDDDEWYQSNRKYTINHTGYAFLESPSLRAGARGNYPHAWAEPVFSMIKQSAMTEKCWWRRKAENSVIYWAGVGQQKAR